MICNPSCGKLCPPNSQINLQSCQCFCNKGYKPLIPDQKSGCTPTCSISCSSFSTVNLASCTCTCNEGYDKIGGICLPSCRLNCQANSVLDTTKCKCVCKLGLSTGINLLLIGYDPQCMLFQLKASSFQMTDFVYRIVKKHVQFIQHSMKKAAFVNVLR